MDAPLPSQKRGGFKDVLMVGAAVAVLLMVLGFSMFVVRVGLGSSIFMIVREKSSQTAAEPWIKRAKELNISFSDAASNLGNVKGKPVV